MRISDWSSDVCSSDLEADAFAALLQNGAAIEEVAAQTGVSKSTVRRRLALASLCGEVKAAVRAGEVPLSVAEALTLGSTAEQPPVLGQIGRASCRESGCQSVEVSVDDCTIKQQTHAKLYTQN